jgi:ASC-1-like (ASCH) protein
MKNKNMITFTVLQSYFEYITLGKKTIEGRINKGKASKIKPGDIVQFIADTTKDTCLCEVESITIYHNFQSMLEKEGLQNMLPGIENITEGISIYESFSWYKEQVTLYGALAIKIKICKNL